MKNRFYIFLIGIAFVGCSGDNEATESVVPKIL
jgi:hypothetical protein